MIVELSEAQKLGFGGEPLATAIVIQGEPGSVPPAARTLLEITTVQVDLGRPVHQAKQTIGLIRWLLWVVAAGIIGSMVYLSALERLRDFAVLKAIGSLDARAARRARRCRPCCSRCQPRSWRSRSSWRSRRASRCP